MDLGEHVAAVVGDGELHQFGHCAQAVAQHFVYAIDAGAFLGRDGDCAGEPSEQTIDIGVEVDLVEDHDLGNVLCADGMQRPAHGVDIALYIGRRGVDHVQQQVGVDHDVEGALERFNQLSRELADKADRVGEEELLAAR